MYNAFATQPNAFAGPNRTAQPTWRNATSQAMLQRLYNTIPTVANTATAWNVIAVATLVFAGPTVLFATLVPYLFAILFLAPRQPFVALMVYFSYFSIEGMYKYASSFSQAIYIIAPMMMAFIQFNWISVSRQQGTKTTLPPGAASLYAFLGIALLQAFNPLGISSGGPSAIVSGIATAYLWYVGPLLMYFVAFNTVKNTQMVLLFFYVTILVSTVVSVVAILQLVMGQTWTWQHFPGVQLTLQASGETYRPPSTTATGAGGCAWARLGIILPIGLLSSGVIRPERRRLMFAALIINGICLIISGVRLLAFQSMFDLIVFVLLVSRNRQQAMRTLTALAVGGGVAIYVAGLLTGGKITNRYAETLQNPLMQFQKERGYNVISFSQYSLAYPLGQGYSRGLGNWQDVAATQAANAANGTAEGVGYGALRDTAFGALCQDVGLPGMLAAFFGVGALIYQGYFAYRNLKTTHMRAIGGALYALMCGLVPGTFAGPVLQAATYFWIAAGLVMMLPQIEARDFPAEGESADGAGSSAPPRRVNPSELRRREREAAEAAARTRRTASPQGGEATA